jgi:hypothetical protein
MPCTLPKRPDKEGNVGVFLKYILAGFHKKAAIAPLMVKIKTTLKKGSIQLSQGFLALNGLDRINPSLQCQVKP